MICVSALLLTALLAAGMLSGLALPQPVMPGSDMPQRRLLRIWVTNAPGGSMRWLQKRLQAFEKANPGVMTYVRSTTPEECKGAETKPDVILHMPGDLSAPEELFCRWQGDFPCDEPLLRSGRWKAEQQALPLCWSAWVMAIDQAWDVAAAATPAPTPLLGRPAATVRNVTTPAPPYPAEKITAAETPLLAPSGSAVFALQQLLPPEQRPVLDARFLKETPEEVYKEFLNRRTASALLTTGQMTAFESLQRAGKGFAARMLIPESIITDQVWLAGMCVDSPQARALIAFLLGEEAQRALAEQGLYGVDASRVLYTDGNAALVEAAGRRSLTVINAYVSAEDVSAAAWQAFFGYEDIGSALMPLL